VRERLGAEEIDQLRRRLDDRLHRRVLAVEDAQRIAVQAAPRVLVERVGMLLEVGDQRGAVRAALVRLAEAVDLEANVAALDQAEVLPERAAHQDLLGVDVRAGVAERLDVDLVELAVAALLRPLVAEHRDLAPQAQRPVVERVVLDHRPHDAGGRLGTQRQLSPFIASSKEYISFSTMSVTCAEAAHEQRVGSTIGVRTLR
jgi:hypothetical protein